ncbi:helix-turn-helix transcriptional regulator [Gordoniibacillus kamchatkensis]|uniref:helix-turn-helix transcriptional regulator n=1 Tax=Gordoniibacillus kamchatkensis TaxID=1590651 RepID=UPI000AD71667|nr:PAS domain-containing protein [Paenibacillus sp. VKM B-2647]
MKGFFDRHKLFVDFLAMVLGPSHEIVLHDLENLDHSIVAIKNNHISGRKVGDPATDLVLKILNDKEMQKKEFVYNYSGYSKNGKRLRSSTYFIRNEDGQIVGMLCINSDMTNVLKFMDSLAEFMNIQDFEASDQTISENLSSSIEDLTLTSIQSILNSKSVEPERMTQEEKIEVVSELNQKGTFLLKGAVSEVAKHLKTSEATIYRYLQKLK